MAGFSGMMKQVTQPKRTYQPVSESVQGAVADVIDKGGALMQRAETRGKSMASRSGLLNSSMAVGAAQGAVIDAATPLGAQQAQQNFQRNENERAYGRQTESEIRNINQERTLQDDSQTFQGGESALDRAFTGEQNDAQRTFQATQSEMDRGLTREQAEAERAFNATEAERQRGFQGMQADADRGLTREQAQADRSLTQQQAGLDRSLNERIANMNLDAADREGVSRMLVSYDQVYAQQFSAIMANPNMNADDREAALEGIANTRANGIALTEQAYGVRIDFGNGGGAAAPAPTAPVPPGGLSPAADDGRNDYRNSTDAGALNSEIQRLAAMARDESQSTQARQRAVQRLAEARARRDELRSA